MASEVDIQETFYNHMISISLEADKYESFKPEIVKPLMKKTLNEFCKSSLKVTLRDGTSSFGFQTVRGDVVTMDNVPKTYQELFLGLIAALTSRAAESAGTGAKAGSSLFDRILDALVEKAIDRPQFATTISRFTTFYLELTAKVVEPVVSIDTIRDTFYNIMVDEYFSNLASFKSDVETLESYIFICLSARAIVSILSHSLHSPGIRLFNNALVVKSNCPAEYQPMFERLWILKTAFDRINPSPALVQLINETVAMKPDSILSPELATLKTPQINEITAIISELSIGVSRMAHFKAIIGEVLSFCSNL